MNCENMSPSAPASSSRNDAGLRALLFAAILVFPAAALSEFPELYQQESAKPLPGVMEDLEFAITDRNFRIVSRLLIGEAIRENGNPDFPDNRIILMCNVGFAERMLRLDPSYVNLCPIKITVREVSRGGRIVIAGTLLPDDSGRAELDSITGQINGLLREMVDYAADEKPRATSDRVN